MALESAILNMHPPYYGPREQATTAVTASMGNGKRPTAAGELNGGNSCLFSISVFSQSFAAPAKAKCLAYFEIFKRGSGCL